VDAKRNSGAFSGFFVAFCLKSEAEGEQISGTKINPAL